MSSDAAELFQQTPAILTDVTIQRLRRYIQERNPSLGHKRRAAVFADAVHRAIDDHLPRFDSETRSHLRKTLVSQAVERRSFNIDIAHVFMVAAETVDGTENDCCQTIATWLSQKLNTTITEETVREYVAEFASGYELQRSSSEKQTVATGVPQETPEAIPETAFTGSLAMTLADTLMTRSNSASDPVDDNGMGTSTAIDVDHIDDYAADEHDAFWIEYAHAQPDQEHVAKPRRKLRFPVLLDIWNRIAWPSLVNARQVVGDAWERTRSGLRPKVAHWSVSVRERLHGSVLGWAQSSRSALDSVHNAIVRAMPRREERIAIIAAFMLFLMGFAYAKPDQLPRPNEHTLMQSPTKQQVAAPIDPIHPSSISVEQTAKESTTRGRPEASHPDTVSSKVTPANPTNQSYTPQNASGGSLRPPETSSPRVEAVKSPPPIAVRPPTAPPPAKPPSIHEQQPTKPSRNSAGVLTMTASAYDLSIESCGKDRNHPAYGITFSGTRATEGRTVAVDPSVIPLGSRLYIWFPSEYAHMDGYYVAEDTGGLIKGKKIDIFLGEDEPNERKVYNEAMRFGLRQVDVLVVD